MPLFEQNIPEPQLVDRPRPQFDTPPDLNTTGELLSTLGTTATNLVKTSIFNKAESELTDLDRSTLGQINTKVGTLETGVQQGSITPLEYKVKRQNILKDYINSYPGLSKEISAIENRVSGSSAVGAAFKQQKSDLTYQRKQMERIGKDVRDQASGSPFESLLLTASDEEAYQIAQTPEFNMLLNKNAHGLEQVTAKIQSGLFTDKEAPQLAAKQSFNLVPHISTMLRNNFRAITGKGVEVDSNMNLYDIIANSSTEDKRVWETILPQAQARIVEEHFTPLLNSMTRPELEAAAPEIFKFFEKVNTLTTPEGSSKYINAINAEILGLAKGDALDNDTLKYIISISGGRLDGLTDIMIQEAVSKGMTPAEFIKGALTGKAQHLYHLEDISSPVKEGMSYQQRAQRAAIEAGVDGGILTVNDEREVIGATTRAMMNLTKAAEDKPESTNIQASAAILDVMIDDDTMTRWKEYDEEGHSRFIESARSGTYTNLAERALSGLVQHFDPTQHTISMPSAANGFKLRINEKTRRFSADGMPVKDKKIGMLNDIEGYLNKLFLAESKATNAPLGKAIPMLSDALLMSLNKAAAKFPERDTKSLIDKFIEMLKVNEAGAATLSDMGTEPTQEQINQGKAQDKAKDMSMSFGEEDSKKKSEDFGPVTREMQVANPAENRAELEQIKEDEGFRSEAYKDSVGKWTIGYGTTKDVKEGDKISVEDAERRLERDFLIAEQDARKLISNFTELPRSKQGILINMAYNLGRGRLAKFKKMIAAIEKEDFKTTAKEMKKSDWYRQVGSRAKRLVERMKA